MFSNEVNRIIDPHGLYNRIGFVQAGPDALREEIKKKSFLNVDHSKQFGVSTIVSQSLAETHSVPIRKMKVSGKWSIESHNVQSIRKSTFSSTRESKYSSLSSPNRINRPLTSPTPSLATTSYTLSPINGKYTSNYYHSAIKKLKTRYRHDIARGIPCQRINLLK